MKHRPDRVETLTHAALGVLLLAGLVVALSACASRGRQLPRPVLPTDRVEMEPLQILAQRGADGRVELLHRDATSLFRAGSEAYESQDYERAVAAYSLLLKEFPGSTYRLATRYNLGLSLEELERWAEAAPLYQAIIAEHPADKDGQDARFRLAVCLRRTDRPEEAVEVLQVLLAQSTLSRSDRHMAHVRLGEALLQAGRLDEAESAFRSALQRPRLKGRPAPLLAKQFVAEAQMGIAEVEHERFRAIAIRLPQSQMEKDISDKARAFLRAQAGYLRTIRTKVTSLVTAAGLKVGTLYEEFYTDLLKAPVPDDLSEEEVEVYFDELRKVIRPLVQQAIHVYERNLIYAERFGAGDAWVAQTQGRLDRLRSFMDGDIDAEPGVEVFKERGVPLAKPETDPDSPNFVGPPEPYEEK